MPEPKDTKPTALGKKAEGPARSAGTKTKAQIEFEKYKARVGAPGAAAGTMRGAFARGAGFPAGPASFPGAGPGGFAGGLPGWALPPSIAALPPGPGGAFFGPGAPGPGFPGGSVGDRLGETLRLGLDVLNAGLAGSVRLLGGLSGIASGLGTAAWPGHGGSCGCGGGCECDSCATPCGYDCCCALGADRCCRSSVGSCCC